MGAVSYTSGSGSFNVPSVVQRAWVSCIGGGANGNPNLGGDGGGGGGWGNGDKSVNNTTINYSVGGIGGNSSCLSVVGGGASGRNGGGFAGPSGSNGGNGNSDDLFSTSGSRGGAAGGVNGGGDSRWIGVRQADSGILLYYRAGGGGNGNDGFGGVGGNGQNADRQILSGPDRLDGGDGGNYGGGGGGWRGVYTFVDGGPGDGRGGFVYVSWIDLTAGKTTLSSGESTTVSWNSPVTNGSTTVSWNNTGNTAITQTYTRTDSRGAQSTITFTILPEARINSFTANPNPQTSGSSGVPSYSTTLSWSSSGANSASINQGVGAVGANGSELITNLPQSVAGSNSPATRTYTLTVTNGFNTDTASVTVSVYNDNTPNNFSFPNRSNLLPNTVTSTSAQITGIDMPTLLTAGPNVQVSNNNSSWSSTTTVTNSGTAFARAVSPAFNTDPNGATNSAQFYADVGPLRRFFTLTTRAPDVNETFNYSNEDDRVPYPDIDTIPGSPDQYISSNTLTVDDVEIDVEVKTNNSNAQVRIKQSGSTTFGNWIDVRQI